MQNEMIILFHLNPLKKKLKTYLGRLISVFGLPKKLQKLELLVRPFNLVSVLHRTDFRITTHRQKWQ